MSSADKDVSEYGTVTMKPYVGDSPIAVAACKHGDYERVFKGAAVGEAKKGLIAHYTAKHNGAPVQYGLQFLVNAGRPSEYWHFDSDYPLRSSTESAWDDYAEARAIGYIPAHLRVVAVTVLPAGETS